MASRCLCAWIVVLCCGLRVWGQHEKSVERGEPEPFLEGLSFKLTTNLIATCRSRGESKVRGISDDISLSLLDYAKTGNVFSFTRFEAIKEPWRVVAEGTYVLQNVEERFMGIDYDLHGEWFSLDLSLRYQFLKMPILDLAKEREEKFVPTLALGSFAGMRYVDTTLESRNFRWGPLGPVRITLSDSIRWVEPFVGLESRLELTPKLSLGVEVDIHFGQEGECKPNVIGGIEYEIGRGVFFTAGYRLWTNDFDRGPVGMDLRHHGPYIGIGIRF